MADRQPLRCADCDFSTYEGQEWRIHVMNWPEHALCEDPRDSLSGCTAECGFPALCFMYPEEQHDGCPRQSRSSHTGEG